MLTSVDVVVVGGGGGDSGGGEVAGVAGRGRRAACRSGRPQC